MTPTLLVPSGDHRFWLLFDNLVGQFACSSRRSAQYHSNMCAIIGYGVGMLSAKPIPVRSSTGIRVAVVTARVTAGWPSPADDYLDGHIDLSRHLITRPAATFLVRVSGWSMRDAGIHDGDTLIVDRSLRARDGQIVVAVVDGDFVVKYLRTQGHPRLVAAHPDYPEIPLQGREHQIWGTVTWVLHHAP